MINSLSETTPQKSAFDAEEVERGDRAALQRPKGIAVEESNQYPCQHAGNVFFIRNFHYL